MSHVHDRVGRLPAKSRTEVWEARLIFAVTFPVFLLLKALGRLLPAARPFASPPVRTRPSIVAEARIAASTCTAFAFMG
jgi:hypothetical protein